MHSYSGNSVKAARLFFAVYLLFLFYILFLTQDRTDTFGGYNLIPFHNIVMFFRYYFVYHEFTFFEWFANIPGNILILLPFGLLLPFVRGKRTPLGVIVLAAAVFSVLVEGIQFFSGLGELDIDDVLLNILGGLAGGFIACHAEKTVEKVLGRCAGFLFLP